MGSSSMREHTRTHTHTNTHNTLSLRSPMTETLTRALRRSGDISTSTTEIICCRPDGIFCLPWISPVRISVASSACTTCPTRLGRRRVSKLPIMRGNVARQIGAGARAAPIKPAWHTSESSSKRVITLQSFRVPFHIIHAAPRSPQQRNPRSPGGLARGASRRRGRVKI